MIKKKFKVLCVDDEPDIVSTLRRAFRKDYEVVSATSGAEGIELIKSQPFDLIISDQRMPGVTGEEVLKFAKETQPEAIRILLTGYSDIESLVKCVNDAGIHKYIAKPWEPEMLRLTVLHALESQYLEEKLRKSQELLREAQEIAGLGSYAMDISTGMWESSQVFDKLFGINEAYARTRDGWAALVHPDDRTMMADYITNEVLGQGKVFDKEYRIIRHDDHAERWLRGLGKLEFDASGHPLKILGTVQNITERRQTEELLLKQKQFSDDVINSLPGVFYMLDQQGGYVRVNPRFLKVSGYSRDELNHMTALDLFEGEDKTLIAKRVQEVFELGQSSAEAEFITKSGQKIPYYFSGLRTHIDGQYYLVGLGADITERKRAEAELRIAATAFESQESLLITDASSVILRVNQGFIESTGYTAEEAVGQTPQMLKSGRHDAAFYTAMWESIQRTGKWQGEIWDRRKNGEVYPKWLSISAVKGDDGAVTHYVGSHIDITERKAAEEKVQHMAFYDYLTNLPNRRLLLDRLQHALASGTRSGRQGALLFIDLDNFKTLNDTHGHVLGDLLLQQVAERLILCVREGDTVARMGGDEFVVVLEALSEKNIGAAAQAEAIGEKILYSLGQPYLLQTHECRSTPSIGATLFNGHEQGTEELLKQADIAMYQAKKAGRNTLRFFDSKMQDTVNARSVLEEELHKALENQQFELYYQIQVDTSPRPIGAEALIRWIHPERGVVSPLQFIPLAEETGLILPIGQWVLETACAQIKAWQQDALTRDLVLAVNVSPKQFHQTDFVAQVQATVQRHNVKPKLLKLELTESMLLENIEDTIAIMNTLKEMGVQFSLDDFGTGYSSLQYLKQLPLVQLKIDQSFVRDIGTDSSDRALVRTIIAMAHSLNLDVIAEGVETEEQRQFLMSSGCIHHQGFLFGKPIPLDQFETLLKQMVT